MSSILNSKSTFIIFRSGIIETQEKIEKILKKAYETDCVTDSEFAYVLRNWLAQDSIILSISKNTTVNAELLLRIKNEKKIKKINNIL